jgi:SH3 domain protein
MTAVPVPAQAQATRYISDQVEIPLRAGTSTRFRIVRMLPSGTSVTLLSEDEETGYAQVRTENGTQGWILSRYLLAEPVARDQLQQMQQSLGPLQSGNEQLRQQLQVLQEEKRNLEAGLEQAEKGSQRLNQDLTQIRKTAANAIAIDERNKLLEQQAVELERTLQIVQQENRALSDTSNQSWFVRGAGVLIFGLIIGLIIPQIRWRKPSPWSDL